MNKTFYLILLLSCQGCSTYIKGDLASKNLSDDPLPIMIAHLEEINIGDEPSIFLARSLKSPEGKFMPKEDYTLSIDYNVSTPVGDGLMTCATALTLGIIPLYSTCNTDAHVKIFKDDSIVYETEIDSRTHTVYGWLLVYLAEKKESPDLINWNEGSGMKYFKYEAIRERIEGRLTTLMEDEAVYNQITK